MNNPANRQNRQLDALDLYKRCGPIESLQNDYQYMQEYGKQTGPQQLLEDEDEMRPVRSPPISGSGFKREVIGTIGEVSRPVR